MRRLDYGKLDAATTVHLLELYGPMLRAVVRLFGSSERDDLLSIGQQAILEAHLTHRPEKASEETWVRKVIHWRLAAGVATRHEAEDSTLTGRAEVLDGHEIDHNPELGYLKTIVLEHLRELPPRQSTVIMAFMQGETFAEIGASLGISPQHAHIEYQAAIRHLRKLVAS